MDTSEAIQVLIAQAAGLREMYFRNRQSPRRFVATITPEKGDAVYTMWEELDKVLIWLGQP